MNTLKNIVKTIALIVVVFSFSANAAKTNFLEINKNHKLAVADTATVYSVVEKLPGFQGGLSAFGTYLSKNIKYPKADRENNIQGKVFITFVVERDGHLSQVTAVRGPSETLKKEAVRVIAASPKWVPAKVKGKVVRAKYTVPVNFVIGQEQ